MFDIQAEPRAEDRGIREAADLEKAPVAAMPGDREHRRAERVRKAYQSHYLGTPQELP
jgi:hypothetical protein